MFAAGPRRCAALGAFRRAAVHYAPAATQLQLSTHLRAPPLDARRRQSQPPRRGIVSVGEAGRQGLEALQAASGLPWWVTLLACGVGLRLGTVPLR
eukprot:COSAG01_NODE_4657_length_4843_cov_5.437395_5_plen_96_part_00